MTMPNDEEYPQPVFPVQPLPPQPARAKSEDGLSDLFRGVQEDDISDLTDVTDEDITGAPDDEDIIEEDELSDLFTVTQNDIVGRRRGQRKPQYRLPPQLYRPPQPPTIGGLR